MRNTKKIMWSLMLIVPVLFGSIAFGQTVDEDDTPDVTARVARVTFISGEAQIRRTGTDEWEKIVSNLPIVEGDEIVTDDNGRVEIQLDKYSHIRLIRNTYLKVTGLQDAAVALSLPEGSMNVRLTKFDNDSAFFEVDAPQSTIAVRKAGMYRIDAGSGKDEVRVSVTKGGEARVYSETSGFTLKNGRSAVVRLGGEYAGEWETAEASRFTDEFDNWSLDRDSVIAKRLKDAHYDKYYDSDIYGADDLNDYGDWIHTRDYGYVWQPYQSSLNQYSNWSPYRYGHWRWVPPYGWTWVNDEPWGWATYHHGRWISYNGRWIWTPYGYVRRTRNWWYPALVGFTVVDRNVCWYPLPYNYGYYNYNYYIGGWGGGRVRHGGPRGHGNNGSNPVPTPTPGAVGPVAPTFPPGTGPSVFDDRETKLAWFSTPPLQRVPSTAIVSTPISSFGRDRTGFGSASPTDAKIVLTKSLAQNGKTTILPTVQDLDGRVSPEIKAVKPNNTRVLESKPRTGAAVRTTVAPMDKVLQTKKIYGDREPVRPEVAPGGVVEPRKTGVITRQTVTNRETEPIRPEVRSSQTTKPQVQVKPEPVIRTQKQPSVTIRQEPVRPEPVKPATVKQPTRQVPVRQAPVRQEPVKPAPVKQPTRQEPVRQAPSRQPSAPSTSKPKQSAPTRKSEPAPSKPQPSRPATSAKKTKGD